MKKQQLTSLQTIFENERNIDNAVAMEKYMRGRFPFIGLRSPDRKRLSKPFLKDVNFTGEEEMIAMIKSLWEFPEREYQYVAVDYLVRNKKHLTEDHLELVAYLITHKSWWDTVDLIASHLVGALFSKYPHLIVEQGKGWIRSDNMWLQRTMLIFQLKYKEDTDEALLFSNIEQTLDIDEFFIQKAIGWSLREYSKTNPDAVIRFIENQDLSNLAQREGLKHIQK